MFFAPHALIVSVQGWLSRVKSWVQPDHGFEIRSDTSHIEKISHSRILKSTSPCPPSRISLELPSQTISLNCSIDSDSDSELGIEMESEFSSTESSRCPTPLEDFPCVDVSIKSLHLATELSLCKTITGASNTPTPLNVNRDALLAEYSHQELVLLEFITHTSNAQPSNIDQVLLKFSPGFSHACQCTSLDEESEDLCEVCQLLDSYMDYSLKRFRGMDLVV